MTYQQRLIKSLNAYARYYCRHTDDAEDLLQDALLEALYQGRSELTVTANLHWLRGVIRNLATQQARTAIRRRQRDSCYSEQYELYNSVPEPASDLRWLTVLPAGQRLVARLILGGHSRNEICYLLGLSDAALRQRLSSLRRQLHYKREFYQEFPALAYSLPYGRIRRQLLPLLKNTGKLGSHDPDGHLFVVSSKK